MSTKYWPTSLKTISVQTHTRDDAAAAIKMGGRRIAYSVRGMERTP